jgi:hypothetical protein
MTMAKISRTNYLQNLVDSLREPEHYEFTIEFRPGQGWFAVPCDPRWFGDDGEYLGSRWQDAVRRIKSLL